jgi:hypothetical protein
MASDKRRPAGRNYLWQAARLVGDISGTFEPLDAAI